MKLGEAELFGPTDHDGVCTRDIEAALHDVGREQNVGAALDEAHHPVVDLVRGQFAVETDDAKIGRDRLHARQHGIEILDAGADQEALSVAPLLPHRRGGNRGVRQRSDFRCDRKPVSRWRRDDTQIPEPGKAGGKGARDRRGAHPERMDALGQSGELRLLGCAKMLLLVDDDEAKIVELHVLRGESLRSDHDFYLAAS